MKKQSKQVTPKPTTSGPSLQVTVSGTPEAVRSALEGMRFAAPATAQWSLAAARRIALQETGVPDASLDDTLGGQKLHMFLQETRDNYVAACCEAAKQLGHVSDPSNIPAKDTSTVMEVSDAL